MRVAAGEAKGRRLAPVRSEARPTAGQVKEAIFSSLGPSVAGARVLDLYAGSGALGIEALSRGAASAVFVDRDPRSEAAIRRNLAGTGLGDRARVVREPVERFLSRACGEPFDIVLLDPPYAQGMPLAALEALASHGYLREGSVVVVESRSGEAVDDLPPGLHLRSARRYGDTSVLWLGTGEA